MNRIRIGLYSLPALLMVASILTPPAKSDMSDNALLSGAQVDPKVLAIMRRSCRDCHTEATRYPWYSYVAPVSWLIKSDVSEGRTHLNLSRWSEYSLIRQQRSLSEIANQVKDGEMLLRIYTLIHREAKLSEAEVDAIFQWTQAERDRLIAQSSPR